MTRNRRGMIAALSFLGLAALLFAAALARALSTEPVAAAEPQVVAPPGSLDDAVQFREPTVPSETVLSTPDIALAVDHDPFLPERSRPEPYRLPGEGVLETPEAPAAPPVPNFQLTGTVVAGDRGVAVIQVDEAAPRVLGVGESLLGFRLDAVAANTVTLVRGERTLYLLLASGEPQPAAEPSNRRNANAASQLSPAQLRSLQQRFGDGIVGILERAQQGGNPAQAQAVIEQLIQQSGRGGRGGVTFRMRQDTTDVPLRTPDNR